MTQEAVQRKIQFVLKKYGISPTRNILLNFFSMSNEIFFIESGRKHYVLKNCMKKRDHELLGVEIALMKHLNENGCPTFVPVPDLKGNDIVEYNGDLYLMTQKMGGRYITWNMQKKKYMFTESFRGLAQYHKAVATLPEKYDTDLIKTYEHDRTMQWITDLEKEVTADKSGRESVKRMLAIIDDISGIARTMQDILTDDVINRCETLMVHGDFHFYNCTFHGRWFYGCHDFDFIRRDLKIFDITWLVMVLGFNFYRMKYGEGIFEDGWEPGEDEQAATLVQIYSWFKQYYFKIYSFNETELKLLPEMEKAMLLFSVRFFKLSNSEEECLKHVDWFEWQCANIDKKTRIIRSALESVFGL
jgi:Ser/Thr protein kinase RdoA (MazF antagonist)